MKRVVRLCFCCLFLLLLGGCQKAQIEATDQQVPQQLVKKSVEYSVEQWKDDDIPLNELVKVNGKIEKSDGHSKKVKYQDRFILNFDGYRIQVMNNQKKVFHLGDQVTVYGEYYGFVKAMYIQ